MSVDRGLCKWAALAWLVAASLVSEPAPAVRTRSGWVRGALVGAGAGSHHLYTGVPYATVDQTNRFQAPLPPPTWDGVFDATEENSRCPQKMIGSVILGDPDCLKLNIYTPARAADHPLPVMVFIHGGCFFEGTGSGFLYGGDFFTEYGVVFVSINYRLNVEGFLCLGIKEAPGNAGLKDQIAALKWVKDNIEAFGGDPDNVTLFGESAGAVSISYLMLAPAARGLFHKAILQSGSTLAPWGMQHDPIKTASTLVKELGYITKNPHEIYQILKTKSINELINAIKYTSQKNYITAETLFVPCVENEIPGVDPIVTRHPADVILADNYTKIPMIIGFNDNEGIYFTAKDYGTSLKHVEPANILQPDLVFPSEEDRNMTVEKIRSYYFSPGKEEMIEDMVDLYSDMHFKVPTVLESELYARTSDQPIFYYLFKYSGYMNVPKQVSGLWVRGASHADELFYLFKPHALPLPQRALERRMLARMLTMWTNFAKYTDPTPQTSPLVPLRWRPSRRAVPEALIIDSRMRRAPLWDPVRVSLWNDTYARYRRRNYGFAAPNP